jgi:hypothetical protein
VSPRACLCQRLGAIGATFLEALLGRHPRSLNGSQGGRLHTDTIKVSEFVGVRAHSVSMGRMAFLTARRRMLRAINQLDADAAAQHARVMWHYLGSAIASNHIYANRRKNAEPVCMVCGGPAALHRIC